MWREETKEAIKVMQAFADGKVIQFQNRNHEWEDIDPNKGMGVSWDWCTKVYRIKPGPHYRPFENANEFIEAQIKHGMYLYFKSNGAYKLATGINMGSIAILWDSKQVEEISYKDLFIRATWQDGTPCGVKEK